MKSNRRLHEQFLTNTLLVLSIFFFKQGQTGTRWGTLAGLSLTETITKEMDCHRLKFLTNQQKGICQKYVEVMDAVRTGTSDALKECRRQFKDRRWNCSFVDSNNPFGNLLKTGSKETAFVYSIISAGVTHAVARGCSTGRLRKCGCDKTLNGQSEEGFEWSGCSDNVAYGSAFAMTFLDPREHLRKKSLLPRAMMNLHNNNVGRKIVENNMKIQCKCHGVSGSCEMKTCWKTLPSFHDVGDALKALYDRAQMVELRKLGSRLELVALTEPYIDSFQIYKREGKYSPTDQSNKTPNADKTNNKNKNLTKGKQDKKINKTTGHDHNNNTTTENTQISTQFSTEESSESADIYATITDFTPQNSINNNLTSISAFTSSAHPDKQKRQLSKRRISTRQSEMKISKETADGSPPTQNKPKKQQKRNREWIPYNAPIFKRQPETHYHVSSGENQPSHQERNFDGQLRAPQRQKKLTSSVNISTEHLPYNEQHEKYLSLPNRKLSSGKGQQLFKRRQRQELLKRRQRQQQQDKQERLPDSTSYVNQHRVFMNEPQIPHSFSYDRSDQLSHHQTDSFIRRNDTIFNFYQEFSMDNELVFIEASPDYCEADRVTGSLGTVGRVCSIEDGGDNHQNCHSLCCGRGYTVRRLVVTERCQCRFQWCCEVKCQKCRREVLEYTCR